MGADVVGVVVVGIPIMNILLPLRVVVAVVMEILPVAAVVEIADVLVAAGAVGVIKIRLHLISKVNSYFKFNNQVAGSILQ